MRSLEDRYLRAALDALPDPLFILGEGSVCLFINHAFAQLIACNHASQPPRIEDFWPAAQASNPGGARIDTELVDLSGNRMPCTLVGNDLENGIRFFKVIAASPSAEHFHVQRLTTLGMLAGGVAHDFNNLLAGILGHISYLKTILPSKGPHCESLHSIEEGSRKASVLTQQILNFSKLNLAEELVPVDLSALTVKTWKLLRGAISPEYHLERRVPDAPLFVRAVEGKLAQVIVNLVVNARDALRAGGKIVVSLALCHDQEEISGLFGEQVEAGRYAVLSVTDDGCGMPQDVLSRAFEPYFSTKRENGTGLGLSTVLSIVRSIGGAIDVNSQPGSGTDVRIFLPLAEKMDHVVADADAAVECAPLVGTERVLVVDDEDPVRDVLSLSLMHLGYQVEIAGSGTEALHKFSSAKDSFDLVILDMLMPNVSGDEVFFRMREMNPSVRVLIISGYSSENAVQRILASGGKGFIQKPFTIEELSRKVRQCLEGK